MEVRKGKKKAERGEEWGGDWREIGRENIVALEVTQHSCAPLLWLHCIMINPPRRSSFGHLHPVTTVLLLITSLSEFCVILYCTRDSSDSILFYSNSTDSL